MNHRHRDSGGRRKPKPPSSYKSKRQKPNNGGRKSGKATHHDHEPDDANDGGGDDIMAQLRRQREKKKQQQQQQQQQLEELQSIEETTAATTGDGPQPQPTEPGSSTSNLKSALPSKERDDDDADVKHKPVGDFQYDPTTKRYFHKSAFKSESNNDVCIQRIQKQIREANKKVVCNDCRDELLLGNEKIFRLDGPVTAEDVTKVVYRGTLLPKSQCSSNNERSASSSMGSKAEKWKRKKQREKLSHHNAKKFHDIPCTNRTTLLLATSLEYCTTASKRNAIASILGPRSIATTAKIVPTQSTLEMIQNDSVRMHSKRRSAPYDKPIRAYEVPEQRPQNIMEHISREDGSVPTKRWFSMLPPLKEPRRNKKSSWSSNVPYDCKCKSYLQPTASTFDIIPNLATDRKSATMPHVATISNDDAIYYRTPYSGRGHQALELKRSSKSLQYHGVRFAPYHAADRSFNCSIVENPFVGCLTYDSREDERSFTLRKAATVQTYGASQIVTHGVASPVNDFCFMPDATLQDPGVVAFAHCGDGGVGASFLDILTGSCISIRDNWCHSEPLCVQFRRNDNKNQVLFGHRDGSVSLIDRRSGDALFASDTYPGESFGSATSIQPLKKDNNLVVCRGSFGACRIFDLRRLSNNNDRHSRYQQSTVVEMSIPDSMVHQTRSVECTGLAIDPSESIAIAPFANHDNDILFAMWDISTGELLRTLNLNSSIRHTRPDALINDIPSPIQFCELSNAITSGYEMLCGKNSPIISSTSSSWGLWYKTNVFSDSMQPDGGGIHHITF